MEEQRFDTPRARRGFTMTEVLVAIGIMVAMFALAVPNLVEARASMRATELNSKAEQVYNAAQYRLTSLKTDGMLASRAGVPDIGAFAALEKVLPADYAASASPAAEAGATLHAGIDNIVFASKGSDAVNDYLITASTGLATRGMAGGDFVIEFNPLTGEAYSVFYWEGDAVEADGASPSSTVDYYKAVRAHRSDARYLADHNVAYYNGGATSDLVEAAASSPGTIPGDFEITQTSVDIVNAEELYVRIKNPTLRAEHFDLDKLKITITVASMVDYAKKTFDVTGAQLSYISGESEIDYILDSYYKDASGNRMSFVSLMSGSDITKSGAVADITVEVSYDGESWGSGTQRVNTAFGDAYLRMIDLVDGDCAYRYNADRTAIVDKDGNVQEGFTIDDEGYVLDASGNYILLHDKIYVSTLRHLMNLSSANYEWGTSSYQTIVIDESIDFDGTTWSADSVAAGAHRLRANKNPFYDEAAGKYAPIEPIRLNALFNKGADRTIDGRGNSIRNIRIANGNLVADGNGAGEADTGLFSLLEVNVKNVTLVNPTVEGSDGSTGGIVGRVESAGNVVANCMVIGGSISGSGNVGGLIGSVSSNVVENCTSSADVRCSAGGDSCAGGVIGLSDWTEVKNSGMVPRDDSNGGLAYGSVSGVSNVGGFVGRCAAIKAASCTAQANVSGPSDIGGFVGLMEAGSFTGCSAFGAAPLESGDVPVKVSGTGSNVGGFVGEARQGEISRCLASIVVEGATSDGGCSNYGGFVGKMSGSPKFEGCYSSGDVSGYSNVGGFAGLDADSNGISSSYTTSDVLAATSCGGFVGRIESGHWGWTSDVSYGLVRSANGALDNTFGGFYGTSSVNLDNRFPTSTYLRYSGYNDGLRSYDAITQLSGASYDELEDRLLTVAQSHPYSSSLEGSAFPFAPTGHDGITLDHYGDWPVRR